MVDNQLQAHPPGPRPTGTGPTQADGADVPGDATGQTAGVYLPALTLALMGGVLLLACLLALVATLTIPAGTGSGASRAVSAAGIGALAAVAVALTLLNGLRVRSAERAPTARRVGLPLLAAAVLVPLTTAALVATVGGGLDWPGSAGLLAVALPSVGIAFVALATWSSNRRPTRLLDQLGSPRRVAGLLAMMCTLPLSLVVVALLSAVTGEQEQAATWGAVGAGLVVAALVLTNLVRVAAPTARVAAVARMLATAVVLVPCALAAALVADPSSMQGWVVAVAGCVLTTWAWLVFLAMATYEAAVARPRRQGA